MHQIRQKKPKPSKRNATSSSIAPSIDDRVDERCALIRRASTSDARLTSALVDRTARSTIVPVDRRSRRTISSIAPVDRRSRRAISSIVNRRSRQRDRRSFFSLSLIWALFSISLSLFFRKLFEVKMRGETDFRVKGENIGQPEVI